VGWFNVASVRAMFLPDTTFRFGDHQVGGGFDSG
jgi:hypothetical protein